jgi:hypothetical protein
MSESFLNKQFSEKDLKRLRNLIKGQTQEKTISGIGYSHGTQKEYEEGDVWVEKGKTWTIREGIRENITKLDSFKHVSLPLFCPKCNKSMNHRIDSVVYKQYNHCLNCQTLFETQLKINGQWKDYVNTQHNLEIDHLINEYNQFIEHTINNTNNGFTTEQGDIEKWVGGLDIERIKNAQKETIDYLNSLKK